VEALSASCGRDRREHRKQQNETVYKARARIYPITFSIADARKKAKIRLNYFVIKLEQQLQAVAVTKEKILNNRTKM